MPSSSTHGTPAELALLSCWRQAFIRLHSLGWQGDADNISARFAEVLDVRVEYLGRAAGGEEWDAMVRVGEKMRGWERVEDAADAVSRAAEVLRGCGRWGKGEGMEVLGESVFFFVLVFPESDLWAGANWVGGL